jgi:hypothetical protein
MSSELLASGSEQGFKAHAIGHLAVGLRGSLVPVGMKALGESMGESMGERAA